MSKKLYLIIKTFAGLAIGIIFGFLILLFIANLSLSFDSQLYKTLGVKKPQIIGFQPFWLLQKANKPYEKYINTFTYFSLTLDTDGTIVKLVNPQEEEPGWTTLKSDSLQEKLQQAKKNNLKLSLLIHNSNEASISALLKEPEKHAQNLVGDAMPIMQKYGFTDLNLDIESFEVASESAQQQYTAFIREVKSGVDKNNLGTLTVEVPPISLVQPRLINVEEIAKIADSIVLMAYDFHYIYSYIAGPVAPIGGVDTVREFDVAIVLKEALNVIPPEKVILGIPLYGYEWETISNKPGAPTIPSGSATASNRRIEELLASCDNCTKAYDEQAKQPYVIFQDGDYFHQIYYEDEQSLGEKLKLAKEHKIAGVALWALGYEGENLLEPLKAYKKLFYFDPSLRIIN
ncbi:MAG: glycosyl hydrolase family 18 protein [Candidatus Beckwithbacteria bacterium]